MQAKSGRIVALVALGWHVHVLEPLETFGLTCSSEIDSFELTWNIRMNGTRRTLLPVSLALFCSAGFALLIHSWQPRTFHPYDIAFDLQWLNAFALCFLALVAYIWSGRSRTRTRVWWTLAGLTVWGTVSLALILHGTDFPWNGFWGDQGFRIAMIRRFMTYDFFTDFYHSDLPPFYPPFFFWGAAILGRLFDAAPHLMLKVGTTLLYTVGPILAYWLWRKTVTPLRAGCITVVTFLIHPTIIMSAPHEFIAMTLFIPWWLAYVDSAAVARKTSSWVFGGILGGLLFMTYYYPFFIGALAMLWRLGRVFRGKWRGSAELREVAGGIKVLLVAAIASSPFWLPLLVSMLSNDAHSSQNRWFHTGYANLGLMFLDITWEGLLSLAGLLLVIMYRQRPENAALLRLVGGILGVLLIGFVLGNLDMPILYVKAKELGYRVAGACGGLLVAYAFVVCRRGQLRTVVRAAALLLMLIPLNGMTRIVTHKPTKLARTTTVRLQELLATEDMYNKTVLTDIIELPVFTPAYFFISPGENVSHPAAELKHRLDFLLDLQALEEPYLFWLALRHNRWTPIDYVAAAGRGDPIQVRVNVTNYPDRFKPVHVRYPRSLVGDTSLFSVVGTTRFICLSAQAPSRPIDRKIDFPDDLVDQYRLHRIRAQLSHEGRALFDSALTWDPSPWHLYFDQPGRGYQFSEHVSLVSVAGRPSGDSLLIVFAMRITGEVKEDYRVFLHAFPGQGANAFRNYDFSLAAPSRGWQVGEVVLLSRRLPLTAEINRIGFGLFNDKGRMGEGFDCQIGLGTE